MCTTFESTSPYTELVVFEHVHYKIKNTMSLSDKNEMELDYQDLNPFICLRKT